MTPATSPDIYDENSVFKSVLKEDKAPRRASPAQRLASIFADAPVKAETIDVADFLPKY